MPEFTSSDIFWILFTIAVLFSIVGFIFKKALKVCLVGAIILVIASVGFGYIPEQIERIKNGETTTEEVLNEVSGSVENKINEGNQYIEDNKQSWIDSFTSAWEKVLCLINQNCTQPDEPIKP